jgi:hypothetical protein
LRLRLLILIVAVEDTTIGVATEAHVLKLIPTQAVKDTMEWMKIPTLRDLTMPMPMPTEAAVNTTNGMELPHTPTLADDGTAAATHNVDPAI